LLVLAGVVGFPMLFDSQPRPVAIDIPIEIPDKTKLRPLGAPAAPVAATPVGSNASAPAARVEDSASCKEEIVAAAKPGSKLEENKAADQSNKAQAATKNIVTGAAIAAAGAVAAGVIKNAGDDKAKAAADKAKLAAADKAEADKARKTAEEDKAKKLKADKALAADKAKADAEAKRAKDLLDGTAAKPAAPAVAATAPTKAATNAVANATTNAAATETGRFIVQFGAFSDVAKSREVRQKVERAGLKTYSQIAKTAEGERIRVRVGPFATRAEADKAAAKIKSLDLPASVLTL
jgi:DedD protein